MKAFKVYGYKLKKAEAQKKRREPELLAQGIAPGLDQKSTG
jgi:hypothetical protein